MTQFVKFLREFNVDDSANSSNAESDSTHTFTEFNFGVRLGDFMSAHYAHTVPKAFSRLKIFQNTPQKLPRY